MEVSNVVGRNHSNVEQTIEQQDSMVSIGNSWEALGKSQCPKKAEVAVWFSVLAVQSANVEQICKARQVVHTSSGNRLKTQLLCESSTFEQEEHCCH